jgi:proteic killer suppression protein
MRTNIRKGDLNGYYSIRVNNQWRIVFRWESSSAHDVQIMDYH